MRLYSHYFLVLRCFFYSLPLFFNWLFALYLEKNKYVLYIAYTALGSSFIFLLGSAFSILLYNLGKYALIPNMDSITYYLQTFWVLLYFASTFFLFFEIFTILKKRAIAKKTWCYKLYLHIPFRFSLYLRDLIMRLSIAK